MFTSSWRFTVVTASIALGASAQAAVIPFTETFDSGASNWFDSTGATQVNWVASGGPDGSAYVTTMFDFSNTTPMQPVTLFRGQDNLDSSGDAFVGNWITEGVTEFSFSFRHNAPMPLNFFARFASSMNFPGAAAVEFIPVLPNTWTEISFAIDADNPEFVTFEGSNFNAVFSSIGNIQIGLEVPEALAGFQTPLTFDLDNVSIVPGPGAVALLAIGGAMGARRRRRR